MNEPLALILSGHLSETRLRTGLDEIAPGLAAGRRPLLVNALAMTSYDSEARDLFVSWHRENAIKLSRVAIVTNKPLWHMVIRAMSLASRVKMRPFKNQQDAREWVQARE